MIEFGLFSSQLPYIIFIAAYLLYFGAFSLNHHTREDASLNSKVTEGHAAFITGNAGKTLFCKITSSVKYAAEKLTDIEKVSGNSFSNICFPRNHIISYIHFIGSSVYSRPPPVESLI